jgi:acetolactate synthase regulatory subunit
MRHDFGFGGKQIRRPDARGGLFSGRGYNIDTLNVGPTQDAILADDDVTRGDDATLDQIVKQLNKLVEVLQVLIFGMANTSIASSCWSVAVDSKSRAEVMQITDIFRQKSSMFNPRASPSRSRATKAKWKIPRTDENLWRARSDALGQSGFAAKMSTPRFLL